MGDLAQGRSKDIGKRTKKAISMIIPKQPGSQYTNEQRRSVIADFVVTHWAPSVSLDELCLMLWDMIRYQNFDVESPYNREAAAWAKTQSFFFLPIDDRPLRDRLAGMAPPAKEIKLPTAGLPPNVPADVTFLETEIVDAEIVDVEKAGEDILFID